MESTSEQVNVSDGETPRRLPPIRRFPTPYPREPTVSTERSAIPLKSATFLNLICDAISAVGLPKKGASLYAIKKWIFDNKDGSEAHLTFHIKKALIKGLEDGTLERAPSTKKCHGVNGSFILGKKSIYQNTLAKRQTKKNIEIKALKGKLEINLNPDLPVAQTKSKEIGNEKKLPHQSVTISDSKLKSSKNTVAKGNRKLPSRDKQANRNAEVIIRIAKSRTKGKETANKHRRKEAADFTTDQTIPKQIVEHDNVDAKSQTHDPKQKLTQSQQTKQSKVSTNPENRKKKVSKTLYSSKIHVSRRKLSDPVSTLQLETNSYAKVFKPSIFKVEPCPSVSNVEFDSGYNRTASNNAIIHKATNDSNTKPLHSPKFQKEIRVEISELLTPYGASSFRMRNLCSDTETEVSTNGELKTLEATKVKMNENQCKK